MSLLALTVPISRGEVAFSLVSRLAYRNRVPFSEFLVEMGVSLPRLLIGEDRVLARLAGISGAGLEDLRRSTPREIRAGHWSFLGENFAAEAFRSTCVRGCWVCLRDDKNNGLAEGIIRGIWMLDLVRICPQHGTRLEPLWQIYDRFDRHDSAVQLQKLWNAELPVTAGESVAEPTEFDQWVQHRLLGQRRASNWLEGFGLQAGARFCSALGSLIVSRGDSDGQAEHEPVDLGFDLASQGPEAIAEFLTQYLEKFSPSIGPKRVFGRIHNLLVGPTAEDELAPFRAVLRRHVATTWPLGPGDDLLGEPALSRQRQSVSAMARLLDVDGEELRQRLLASGILSEAMAQKPDDWAVFEPKLVEEILSGLNPGLAKQRFCEVLSLDDASFDGLHASGSLNAAQRPDGRWDPLVAQEIVDQLLVRAQPLARLGAGWHSLGGAAQALGVSCGEIIEMIRTGKLNWIGRYTKASGFASIVVNITARMGGEISAEMFAQSQGVSFTEMLSFLRRRHSPAEIGQREKGRKDRISLTAAQIASFYENFISFRALGLAVKQGWDELAQQLADAGIAAVLGSPQIYRKTVVRRLIDNAAQAEAEFPMEYSL